VRRFGPLRPSRDVDTAAPQTRVSVFAMIETAATPADFDAIWAAPRLAEIHFWPADLAISTGVEVGRGDR
jgi:4-hydroxy-2-oxoheptanedioate aldolase